MAYLGIQCEFKLFQNSLIPEKEYSLVIPAYNEENRIGDFLQSLKSIEDQFKEIIVVCDGNDGTAYTVKRISPTYMVLEYRNRLGKGGAVIEGFKASTGEVIGYVDADGAIGPKEILKVFSSVHKNSPVAIGSRWAPGSVIEVRQPLRRILLGRMYHYLSLAILGLRQKDTQCGLKAFSRDVVDQLMPRVKVRNFSVDTALLYHCKLLGYDVSEVPVVWRDVEGSKVSSLRAIFFMLATMVALRLIHSNRASRIRKILSDGDEILGSI